MDDIHNDAWYKETARKLVEDVLYRSFKIIGKIKLLNLNIYMA